MTSALRSLWAAWAGLSLCMGGMSAEASADAQATSEQDIQAALKNLHDARSLGTQGGIPYFIRGDLGRIDSGSEAQQLRAAPRVQASLRGIAPAFRLRAEDLALSSVNVDAMGHRHLRFQQFKNGLRVVGGELLLHADVTGRIYAANGSARDGVTAAVTPSISEAVALRVAVHDLDVTAPEVERPAPLVYFLGEDDRPMRLAYEVRVTGQRGELPVDERVYVDAETGTRLAVHSQIQTALNRQVYSANNGTSLPGTLRRSEGSSATGDTHVDMNFGHLGTFYQCFFQNFGRDSFDGAGARLRSSVHYSSNYVGAFWNGTQMVYGDGDGVNAIALGKSQDVTVHELTHAVTTYTSNLTFSNQSGALSESLSDIFSAFCESWMKGWVIDSGVYKIGDDVWTPAIPNDAIRYMNDPALDGASLDFYPSYTTGTDVHYSSGIANLAFYLLAQGGSHPRGKTTNIVTGIGLEKAGQIFYWANTNLFTPNTTFEQAKLYTQQASDILGYGSGVTHSIEGAWRAVGVAPLGVLELTNNVPVSGLGGDTGGALYAEFVVPKSPDGAPCTEFAPGAPDARSLVSTPSKLTITLSGGTGNADLYVRFGAQPTLTTFDCQSALPGNEEVCAFVAPTPGRYYIMVYGKADYTNVTLKASFTSATYDPAMRGNIAAGEQILYGPLCVTAGKKILATMTGTGNPDLYGQWSQPPTLVNYTCRSNSGTATEQCLMTVPAAVKNVYFLVYGSAAGTYDLKVNFNAP
ncbi:M4 family metallopeptidase [Myxococcaceae bacterium JPH2]|nr:M4 family metallopeptidase [Myxococcaceae bacterium JPH2]